MAKVRIGGELMKKINKLLSLLLVLVMLVPMLNVASAEEFDPHTAYRLLTGERYYSISNDPLNSDINFIL